MITHLSFYQYNSNESTLADAIVEKQFPTIYKALSYLCTNVIHPRTDIVTFIEWMEESGINDDEKIDAIDNEEDALNLLLTAPNEIITQFIDAYFTHVTKGSVLAAYTLT
jgi:hypothetical protein